MDNYFDDENVFQPDILFVSNERLHVIEEDGLYGAPDLVIEILSPSTAKYDLGEKKDVYERSGVKEYWIIDPATESVHGYFLTNGLFDEIANDKNIIRSRLLNTEFRF
jgi:Uma2 family endonuclease